MKRILTYLFAIAILFFAISCEKEIVSHQTPESPSFNKSIAAYDIYSMEDMDLVIKSRHPQFESFSIELAEESKQEISDFIEKFRALLLNEKPEFLTNFYPLWSISELSGLQHGYQSLLVPLCDESDRLEIFDFLLLIEKPNGEITFRLIEEGQGENIENYTKYFFGKIVFNSFTNPPVDNIQSYRSEITIRAPRGGCQEFYEATYTTTWTDWWQLSSGEYSSSVFYLGSTASTSFSGWNVIQICPEWDDQDWGLGEDESFGSGSGSGGESTSQTDDDDDDDDECENALNDFEESYGINLSLQQRQLILLEVEGCSNQASFDLWVFENIQLNVALGMDDEDLNGCERALLLFSENRSCVSSLRVNRAATYQKAGEYFGGVGGVNGCGDAFRHAFFNALNARDCGTEIARRWGLAHECEETANDSKMDIFNNEIGYFFGISGKTNDEIASSICDMLSEGILHILVDEEDNNSEIINSDGCSCD